jgi:ATP-dependent Zn protease
MVDRFGMTGRGLAVRVGGSDSSEDLVNEMLQTAMDDARAVLQSSRTLLDAVVDALLDNDDLDEAAIDELVSTNTSVAVV